MKTTEKQNTVKRMREIRDQLNKKFADMNYPEEKRYIKKELKKKESSRQVTKTKFEFVSSGSDLIRQFDIV